MKTYTRVCKECGRVFEAKSSRSNFCYDDHYFNCAICGTRFIVPREKLSSKSARLCSKECVNKSRGLLAAKSAKSSLKYICKCTACGKEFKSSKPNARICDDDHYMTCAVCGKTFLASRQQCLSNTQTCSHECRYKLTFETYHSHYDKDINPEAHEELLVKHRAIMLEKYGVEHSLSADGKKVFNIEEKMIEKYGVDHPMKSPEIVARRNQTSIDRYGSACPATGVLNERSKQTLLEKYGVDNYAKSISFLKQVITEPEKVSKCFEFKEDPEAFVKKHFPDNKPTLAQLSEVCGIRDSSIGYILDQIGNPNIVSYCYSKMEDELYTFLVDLLGESAKIERNTFKVITPYELDIYLPEYNFAIECNPTVTHNSSIPGWSGGDNPKPTGYHKMKTDLCEDRGIFLFHIFGYEWTHRKDIIKSMIANVLGVTYCKVHARKTAVREVSDSEAVKFLNANHRQGGAHSSIRLGLFFEDELVSLMTFSKMRKTIGTGSTNLDCCFELVRFCNKLNTSVVGGASKLFKSFINMYNPQEIRSFSDRAHTSGKLYTMLGFEYDHTSDPGYMWVNLKSDAGFARNNAQKNNIKSFLKDDSIDLSKTETQIMIEHNFVQVFDSGVKLWIWRKEI